jgi:hypothetical protein
MNLSFREQHGAQPVTRASATECSGLSQASPCFAPEIRCGSSADPRLRIVANSGEATRGPEGEDHLSSLAKRDQ